MGNTLILMIVLIAVLKKIDKRAKKHQRVSVDVVAGQIGVRGNPGPRGYVGPMGFQGQFFSPDPSIRLTLARGHQSVFFCEKCSTACLPSFTEDICSTACLPNFTENICARCAKFSLPKLFKMVFMRNLSVPTAH